MDIESAVLSPDTPMTFGRGDSPVPDSGPRILREGSVAQHGRDITPSPIDIEDHKDANEKIKIFNPNLWQMIAIMRAKREMIFNRTFALAMHHLSIPHRQQLLQTHNFKNYLDDDILVIQELYVIGLNDAQIISLIMKNMRISKEETDDKILESFKDTGHARVLLFTLKTLLNGIQREGDFLPVIYKKNPNGDYFDIISREEELAKLLLYKDEIYTRRGNQKKLADALTNLIGILEDYIKTTSAAAAAAMPGGAESRKRRKMKGGRPLQILYLQDLKFELLEHRDIYTSVPMLKFVVMMALRLYEIIFLTKEKSIFRDDDPVDPVLNPFIEEGNEEKPTQLLKMLNKFYHFMLVYLQKQKKSTYKQTFPTPESVAGVKKGAKEALDKLKVDFLLERFEEEETYDLHTEALTMSHTYMTKAEAEQQEYTDNNMIKAINKLLGITEEFHFLSDRVSAPLKQLHIDLKDNMFTLLEIQKERARLRATRGSTPEEVQAAESIMQESVNYGARKIEEISNYLKKLNTEYDKYYDKLKHGLPSDLFATHTQKPPFFAIGDEMSSDDDDEYDPTEQGQVIQRPFRFDEQKPPTIQHNQLRAQRSPRSPRSPRSQHSPVAGDGDVPSSLRPRSRSPKRGAPSSHLRSPSNSTPMEQGGGKIKDCKNTGIKKEILGKSMCIYKIRGSRTEFVRYKKEFVALKVYKAEKKADKKLTKRVEKKVVKKAEKKVEKKADKKPTKKVVKKDEKKTEKKAEKKVVKKAENKVENKVVKKTTGKCEKEKRKISKLQDLCKKCKNIHVGGANK